MYSWKYNKSKALRVTTGFSNDSDPKTEYPLRISVRYDRGSTSWHIPFRYYSESVLTYCINANRMPLLIRRPLDTFWMLFWKKSCKKYPTYEQTLLRMNNVHIQKILNFNTTLALYLHRYGISTFFATCDYHKKKSQLVPKVLCKPHYGNSHLEMGVCKWKTLIRGLYRTFLKIFLFKFPFSQKRFHMGQKMYFCQLYKL